MGSSSGQQQQQQGGNNNYSSNNQATDAHILNGCANYSASSDNSSQISASDESSNPNNNNNNNNNHNNNSSNSRSRSSSHSNEDEPQQAESMSFFNETLDLSHEDIQRTLIANMPYSSNSNNATATATATASTAGGCTSNSNNHETQQQQQQEAHSSREDEDTADVFAHLDAFDMLVEFPELDLDDKQALNNTALEQVHSQAGGVSSYPGIATPTQATQRKLLNICDFSPEWSYTEGGVKVLVAGPWTSDGGCYTVLFDAQPVPTVLVQEGVLRCYCPAHEAGLVTLQVACGGYLVSNAAMFEYKLSLLADAPFDASSSNDCLYKFTLLNRLSTIDEKLQLKLENELTVSRGTSSPIR